MKFLCLLLMLHCLAQATTVQLISSSKNLSCLKIYQPYSIKIINAASGTLGYEIYADKKMLIRQVTIPGMGGNKGFQRKADAENIAGVVVYKLSKGIMPSAIKKIEMDSLHIKY